MRASALFTVLLLWTNAAASPSSNIESAGDALLESPPPSSSTSTDLVVFYSSILPHQNPAKASPSSSIHKYEQLLTDKWWTINASLHYHGFPRSVRSFYGLQYAASSAQELSDEERGRRGHYLFSSDKNRTATTMQMVCATPPELYVPFTGNWNIRLDRNSSLLLSFTIRDDNDPLLSDDDFQYIEEKDFIVRSISEDILVVRGIRERAHRKYRDGTTQPARDCKLFPKWDCINPR